ncbi:hypothetical protein Q4488_16835 [Amphritea sp. 1_MG-2023]|uniref:hypothetical protein n=1 Tax=Amphritea sp. 1_MG-2023 TaxID=3062670 RepID=UPI0026E2C9C6|nr:hypothetical protein [Amphritea sp. 1_MG-2023]MDO6565049.1 hypothetical protein [Amphritea sp. 1_MG-2023]
MNIKTLCAVALTAVSATAFAVEMPEFKLVDIDADGFISLEEANTVAALETTFLAADLNKDGLLDEAEYDQIPRG